MTGPDPDVDRLGTGGAVAIGVAGGAVGGLLGGGSGVFFVPALDRFARVPRPVLHGTSTVANIAVCAIGAAVYALAGGAIDLRAGSGLIVGGIIGGFFGAGIISRIPERLLRILFIAVVLLTAAKLYSDAAGLDPLSGRAAISPALLASLWFVVPVTLVAGVVIGAWAAALGLGGGLLAVPALVLLFGADLHTAAGTSLLMFVPNSVVGGVMHLRKGTASPRLGRLLSIGAVPGAAVGALLALMLDSVVLGLVFGTFALAMGVREILQMTRARRTARKVVRDSG
ncbi:sulfite exporter TauE/SafE family protein [Pseudonocardia sp. KRD291]|uniref:sulfite exporter TauE/SafE family protein n=1 Tax=Pseudonocardia sp. KRD291 TaxID=2792007 RepID=UPI001C4A289B|nr:sulfite exporter TauE/SafE family protein [Pseudonocardia sp. KRD291]MBW0106020.1 sulfite exporter TauE/SafE family protein [Pseudonocardia sp. KRD291]